MRLNGDTSRTILEVEGIQLIKVPLERKNGQGSINGEVAELTAG